MSDAYMRSASQVPSGNTVSNQVEGQISEDQISAAVEDDGDLIKYREFVNQIANASDGRVILNRSAAHAAIIVEYLFKKATREVNILTGELFDHVYGAPGVVSAAVDFLRVHPDAKLCILSEKHIDSVHPLITALTREPSIAERVDRRILKPEVSKATPYHFAVADGCCFRFEREKTLLEAVVQFGEKAVGQRLNGVFRHLYNQSLPA